MTMIVSIHCQGCRSSAHAWIAAASKDTKSVSPTRRCKFCLVLLPPLILSHYLNLHPQMVHPLLLQSNG